MFHGYILQRCGFVVKRACQFYGDKQCGHETVPTFRRRMTACHTARPHHLRRPNFPFVLETGRWRGCRLAQAWAPIQTRRQNRDLNWAHGWHRCRRHSGCALQAVSADGLSRLCGGRAPAGSVCLPATLSDGGASGVAAVCRRPVKDPPRQFGERAFTGFPWAPAWLCGLVVRLNVVRPVGKSQCRSVRLHPGLCVPQRPRRCRQQAKRSGAGRACAPRRPRREDCCARCCCGSREYAWYRSKKRSWRARSSVWLPISTMRPWSVLAYFPFLEAAAEYRGRRLAQA